MLVFFWSHTDEEGQFANWLALAYSTRVTPTTLLLPLALSSIAQSNATTSAVTSSFEVLSAQSWKLNDVHRNDVIFCYNAE